jgi:hypothetical protein
MVRRQGLRATLFTISTGPIPTMTTAQSWAAQVLGEHQVAAGSGIRAPPRGIRLMREGPFSSREKGNLTLVASGHLTLVA